MSFNNLKFKYLSLRIGLPIAGATAGYAYYFYIGCASGTCPITSNPWISTIYGTVAGLLLVPWKDKLNLKKTDVETQK
jgi:hypothetical protein